MCDSRMPGFVPTAGAVCQRLKSRALCRASRYGVYHCPDGLCAISSGMVRGFRCVAPGAGVRGAETAVYPAPCAAVSSNARNTASGSPTKGS